MAHASSETLESSQHVLLYTPSKNPAEPSNSTGLLSSPTPHRPTATVVPRHHHPRQQCELWAAQRAGPVAAARQHNLPTECDLYNNARSLHGTGCPRWVGVTLFGLACWVFGVAAHNSLATQNVNVCTLARLGFVRWPSAADVTEQALFYNDWLLCCRCVLLQGGAPQTHDAKVYCRGGGYRVQLRNADAAAACTGCEICFISCTSGDRPHLTLHIKPTYNQ